MNTPSVVADEELVEPIPMMLFCPKCGLQHVDAPDERTPDWTNPPHKSHLCHGCGTIWRPADIPTEGVVAIQSRGSKDTVFYNRAALAASDRDVLVGLLREARRHIRTADGIIEARIDAALVPLGGV